MTRLYPRNAAALDRGLERALSLLRVSNMVGSVADTAGLNKKALFGGSTEVYRTPLMGPYRHSTRPRITRSRRLRRDINPQAAALVDIDIATSSYHPLKPTLKGVTFTT